MQASTRSTLPPPSRSDCLARVTEGLRIVSRPLEWPAPGLQNICTPGHRVLSPGSMLHTLSASRLILVSWMKATSAPLLAR